MIQNKWRGIKTSDGVNIQDLMENYGIVKKIWVLSYNFNPFQIITPLDIAILFLITRRENPYVQRHSFWTIYHLQKEIEETKTAFKGGKAYGDIQKRIYDFLVKQKLAETRTSKEIITANRLERKGMQGRKVYVLPTEKGIKLINQTIYYIKMPYKKMEDDKKNEEKQ